MKMKRASYQRAVEWIAYNDETACLNADEIEQFISVLLVADLWGKRPRKVADDVLRVRELG